MPREIREILFGQVERFRQTMKRSPGLVPLLTQGDSWFAFPALLRANIIHTLVGMNRGRAAWLRLETLQSNGDEMRQMLSGRGYEQMQKVLSDLTLKFSGILFSGGGNDLVGRALLPLVNPAREGMTWMECINLVRFERRIQQIEDAYHELVDLRDDYQAEAHIFVHAYDFPVPGDKPWRVGPVRAGPWMKPHLDSKGIRDAAFQRAIVNFMVKRLDELMQKLEQERDRVVYVRTQGTLTDKDWEDEIHPTTKGFRKLAALFQEALLRTLPRLGTPVPLDES